MYQKTIQLELIGMHMPKLCQQNYQIPTDARHPIEDQPGSGSYR